MDAVDTMTPEEYMMRERVEKYLPEIKNLLEHQFTPVKSFSLDLGHDMLHLKGEKTILSMQLSAMLKYFEKKEK